MARPRISLLTESDLRSIHEASIRVLAETGVLVHHDVVLQCLEEHGATVNRQRSVAMLPEEVVKWSLEKAGKQYVLYGRDPARVARFGFGDLNLISTPGQYIWIDAETRRRRPATLDDVRNAIRLGDALANITIVGSMGQPKDIPETWREVLLTAELLKGSTKPTRTWVHTGSAAKYVLEMYRTVAGGAEALRKCPMTETFLEPISPLQMPQDGLDVVIEYVRAGQPVSIGPMSMTSGTAPGTLAGTLAQENAEILAGIVITQVLGPGTPVLYGGIPHIMDPRTSICSFGSPEQGLMAVAMVEMGRFYGFPVYINVGLTDAKNLDAQAGMEKAATLTLGALAGGELFGHAGICGTDHGASLEWLLADDELMSYVKRIVRGFEITPEKLGVETIRSVGPAGNYLAEEHTVRHYRQEIWRPAPVWTRQAWDTWENNGAGPMADSLRMRAAEIARNHSVRPLESAMAREIDTIADRAQRELISVG
jgi:trimethylamine--corrinoid protein Co-methyltransferase